MDFYNIPNDFQLFDMARERFKERLINAVTLAVGAALALIVVSIMLVVQGVEWAFEFFFLPCITVTFVAYLAAVKRIYKDFKATALELGFLVK